RSTSNCRRDQIRRRNSSAQHHNASYRHNNSQRANVLRHTSCCHHRGNVPTQSLRRDLRLPNSPAKRTNAKSLTRKNRERKMGVKSRRRRVRNTRRSDTMKIISCTCLLPILLLTPIGPGNESTGSFIGKIESLDVQLRSLGVKSEKSSMTFLV